MPEADVLFIHALTGLHPGTGAALGVVDLPIQRERHTEWPTIQASSLKGVLRSACRPHFAEPTDWTAVFGPEVRHAEEFAGALSLTDARLLAFPVRSLRGVFAWITCPAALARFSRDLELLAGRAPTLADAPGPAPGTAVAPLACDLGLSGSARSTEDSVILEEFEYRLANRSGGVAEYVAAHVVEDEATAERLRRNLLTVHDDDFTWFVRHATEVIARVGLDAETKTVRKGALFYEEFLPPESLFYSVAIATASRAPHADHDAAGTLHLLRETTPKVLQIGADETIGKGLCAVRFLGPGQGATA